MKKGGSVKKMANGGVTPSDSTKIYVKKAEKALGAGDMKKGKKALSDAARQANKGKVGFDELGKWKYKTGGMVNSNAKVTASKVAKGRPAKSAEPRTAAKKATGKVGGISKAPKTTAPKMKMGGSMKRK
jgi:hypothetical protein